MELLIEEVRLRPVLWDITLDEYRDNLVKDKAWEEVATLVNDEKKTVKDKWKKLRDCHRQALQRRKTATGQAASRIKKWKYEDQMQFLLRTMAHRSSDSSVPSPSDEAEVENNKAYTDAVGLLSEEETELQLDGYDCEIPNAASTSGSGNTTPIGMEKRKRPEKGADKIVSFMREKYEHKLKTKRPKPLDDIDLFFASAAQSVRKLSRRLQNKVKMQVLSSIAAAEEECEWCASSVAARPVQPTPPPVLQHPSQPFSESVLDPNQTYWDMAQNPQNKKHNDHN